MTQTSKTPLIKKLIEITNSTPEKVFDRLTDKSENYLKKLLVICERLKDAV